MTRARYIAASNSLQELSRISKPDLWDEPGIMNPTFTEEQDEYNAHLDTLRTLSCSLQCKDVFVDKGEYEEGKEYEVKPVEASIYSAPGSKVKALFANGEICHGSDFDKEKATIFLKPGIVYELDCADIGSWHTDFYLKEFPKIAFNSVHFVYANPIAFPISVKSADNWLTTKPTFTEECILVTASKIRDKWDYQFWLIEKLDNITNDGWYWGILCPDGEEWGPLEDLEAERYLVIPKLK